MTIKEEIQEVIEQINEVTEVAPELAEAIKPLVDILMDMYIAPIMQKAAKAQIAAALIKVNTYSLQEVITVINEIVKGLDI